MADVPKDIMEAATSDTDALTEAMALLNGAEGKLAFLRPRHAAALLAVIDYQNRVIEQSQRTSRQRQLAFEAALLSECERRATDVVTVPDGWALVPIEPCPEMVGAWYRYKNGHHFADEPPPSDRSDYGAYRAMLAAAPSLSSGEGRSEERG